MEYLRQHPHVGELFAFLVAFAESLPLIGTIIPGTITMTAVGFLIGTTAIPGLLTLMIVSVAALTGDSIGFAIGYWYNEKLRNIWPFRKHPKWLTLSETFCKKHGGKSIIIGRFVGPARSTVPMIAGLLRLTWTRFFIAAIPSAILWAIAYTLPGIMLGALSKEVPHGELTKFLLSGIAIIAAIWFVFWVIQHFFMQLARSINRITDKGWRYLSRPKHGNWFIRLITNQQQPDDHRQLTLFIFSCLSAILFIILCINVRLHTVLTGWNTPIFHLLQSIHTTTLTNSMIVITIMGAPKTMIFLAALLIVGFSLKKQWRAAGHLAIALFLSVGSVFVFKSLSHSLRPQGFYFVPHSSSFPSGHATLSFVIISFVTFLIAKLLPKVSRWIPYTLATIFIALVAFSRVYLGAHWFTDIIGSVLLAISIFFVCIISYHRMPTATSRLRLSPLSLGLLIIIVFGLTWGIQITRMLTHDQKRYTRIWPTVSVTKTQWWQSPLKYTPIYRTNRLGKPFQPFNVQWLGSLTQIKKTLIDTGWITISQHPGFKTALQRFASYNPEYHMPILPWLYQDKLPMLIMIKHIPNQKMIIELRLWNSNIDISNHTNPLWLGAADVRLPPTALLSLKHRAKVSLAKEGVLTQLLADTKSFSQKTIQVKAKEIASKPALKWDGEILLLGNAHYMPSATGAQDGVRLKRSD